MKRIQTCAVLASFALAAPCFITACAAESSSASDSSAAEAEHVGEAEQAISEGCRTATAASGIAFACGGLVSWNTSPSATYGSAACPDEYVWDFGDLNHDFTAEVAYGDTTITSATLCNNTHLHLEAYFKDASNHPVEPVPYRTLDGAWSAGTCTFSFAGSATHDITVPAGSKGVRLAAKAWLNTIDGDGGVARSPRKVKVALVTSFPCVH